MLLSHPHGDHLFEQIASRQVGLVDRGMRTMPAGRRALRHCYPDADLLRQSSVLIDGKPTTVWFAYRDGRLGPTYPTGRWWRRQSVATALLRRSGQVTQANPEFRTLVGLQPIAGRRETLNDILGPSFCDELARLMEWFAGQPEITGALDVRLPWGRPRRLEFHAERPAGTGDYQLAIRSVEDRDVALTRAAAGRGLGAASNRERRKLLGRAVRRDLAPGEGLGARAQGKWAILVLAGIVRLLIHAEAQEPTLAYAGPGMLLGSHLVPDDDSVPIDVQAVTPCVILQLPSEAIRDLIRAEAGFARAVVDHAQALVGATVTMLAARTSVSLPQRLAREIVQLSGLYPSGSLVPVTEQQLADGVGSIRESVARTIGAFRRSGLVATTRHGLLVLDGAGLTDLAAFDMVPAAIVIATPVVAPVPGPERRGSSRTTARMRRPR